MHRIMIYPGQLLENKNLEILQAFEVTVLRSLEEISVALKQQGQFMLITNSSEAALKLKTLTKQLNDRLTSVFIHTGKDAIPSEKNNCDLIINIDSTEAKILETLATYIARKAFEQASFCLDIKNNVLFSNDNERRCLQLTSNEKKVLYYLIYKDEPICKEEIATQALGRAVSFTGVPTMISRLQRKVLQTFGIDHLFKTTRHLGYHLTADVKLKTLDG